MAKLSKRAQEALEREGELRLQAFEAFRDRYNDQVFDAKVRWFDALSGEGMVTLSDGRNFYIHYTAIEGMDKNGCAFPAEKDMEFLKTIEGKTCRAKIYVSYGIGGMVSSLSFGSSLTSNGEGELA